MYSVQLTSNYIPKKFTCISSTPISFGDSSDSSDDEHPANDNSTSRMFIIDTKPETDNVKPMDIVQTDKPKIKQRNQKRKPKGIQLSSQIQSGIDTTDTYIKMKAKYDLSFPEIVVPATDLMAQTVLKAGYEQQHSVPEYSEGRRQLKRERMAEKAKTRGAEWFHLPATEMTEELKNDLTILKMRRALDPKHFYKKNDPLPKYFQLGTVIESPADFYHSRIPKKGRKRTLVEELLNDAEFRKYGKKKYAEIASKQPKWKIARRKKKR